MSKHPIPDWLRSQFSRIEDEVRKLGPCGVFTQMRTVTQTYFEQQAAAPQPPALGGELEVPTLIEQGMWSCFGYGKDDYRGCTREQIEETREAVRAHLAPLQAELSRMNALFDALATAVGFSKERCEQAGDSPLDCANQLRAEIERLNSVERSYQLREELLEQVKGERDRMIERACELSPEVDRLTARTAELERLLREVVALDPRGEFMGWQLDGRIDAALSKPAGSECCATCSSRNGSNYCDCGDE